MRLILVDGRRLARLMIEHGVGVTVRQTYELKRVDETVRPRTPSRGTVQVESW